jgi:hypothetical protein
VLSSSLTVSPSRAAVAAVVGHVRLETFLLLVGIDVRDHRTRLQGSEQLRPPFVEIAHLVRLQRELILRVRLPGAHADVLNGLQEQACSRERRELRTQPGDHLVRRDLAHREGLEQHIDEPLLVCDPPPPLPAPV